MVTEECSLFFIVCDDCAKGFEWGGGVGLWISVYALDFLPEGSGVCVVVQFLVKSFPGVLSVEAEL